MPCSEVLCYFVIVCVILIGWIFLMSICFNFYVAYQTHQQKQFSRNKQPVVKRCHSGHAKDDSVTSTFATNYQAKYSDEPSTQTDCKRIKIDVVESPIEEPYEHKKAADDATDSHSSSTVNDRETQAAKFVISE